MWSGEFHLSSPQSPSLVQLWAPSFTSELSSNSAWELLMVPGRPSQHPLPQWPGSEELPESSTGVAGIICHNGQAKTVSGVRLCCHWTWKGSPWQSLPALLVSELSAHAQTTLLYFGNLTLPIYFC